MKSTRAPILINKRGYGEEGYFITSEHPDLLGFSAVEEFADTDFSFSREVMEKYLDVNYFPDAPHVVTFMPADPVQMAAQRIVMACISAKGRVK